MSDIARYLGPQIRPTSGVLSDPVPTLSDRVTTWATGRHVRGLAFSRATRTVWAATAGGVVAVDWATRIARRYTVAHGVPPGSAVAAVGAGVVVARTDGGLCRFADGNWTADPHWEGLPLVRAVADAGNGAVAAVTGRSVCLQPAGGPVEVIATDHPLLADARSLVCVGPVWYLATPRGIVCLAADRSLVLLDRTPCHELAVAGELVWAATTDGLKAIRGESVEALRPPSAEASNVTSVAVGPGVVWSAAGGRCWQVRDGVWWGGDECGVRRLAADPTRPDVWAAGPNGLVHLRPSVSGSQWRVLELFAADPSNSNPSAVGCLVASGQLYAGGPGGLWRFADDSAGRDDGIDGGVYGLASAGGACWTLTRPAGVLRQSGAGGGWEWVAVDGIPLAVTADRTTGFILTSRRLYRSGPSGEPEVIGQGWEEPPVCVAVSDAGGCWLGTPRGVLALTPDGQWAPEGGRDALRPVGVRGLTHDGEHLWAATPAGVWCRTPANGWRNVTDHPAVAVGRATAGGVWAAGRGWVARCTHTGEPLPLRDPSVTAVGGVTAVAEHRGGVWLATADGVVRFALHPTGELA